MILRHRRLLLRQLFFIAAFPFILSLILRLDCAFTQKAQRTALKAAAALDSSGVLLQKWKAMV